MAIRNLDWNFYCKHDWSPPSLASPFLPLLHWWGSNRWGDRARGWWECKKCNFYSSASLLSFTAGVCVGGGEGVGANWQMKDGVLTSLIRQPVGLDGIHQLHRLLLHGSLRCQPTAGLHTCSHNRSQFLLSLYRMLVPPFHSCPLCFPSFRL